MRPALPGRTNHLPAGVLVPIIWDPAPTVLVTLRPDHLRSHGGEYCFPGGQPEPEDADIEATARREAHEELGLQSVRILGRLCSMPLYTSDYRLEPFVALVDENELTPDPSEVAAVRRVRLDELVARETHGGIGYEYGEHRGVSPVFKFGDRWLYGATAMTFWELVVLAAPLFGHRPPELVASGLTFQDVYFKPPG